MLLTVLSSLNAPNEDDEEVIGGYDDDHEDAK